MRSSDGTLDLLGWPFQTAVFTVTVVILTSVWTITGSLWLQLLALVALLLTWRRLFARYAEPPTAQTENPRRGGRVRTAIEVLVVVLLVSAVTVLISGSLQLADLYPGPCTIFYVVCVGWTAAMNRHATRAAARVEAA